MKRPLSLAKIWHVISHNLQTCKIGGKLVLITNRIRMWLFDWYQNRWLWITLNGVIAIVLRYFAEFGSFRGQLRKSGWLAIYSFSPDKCHKVHPQARRTRCALCGSGASCYKLSRSRRRQPRRRAGVYWTTMRRLTNMLWSPYWTTYFSSSSKFRSWCFHVCRIFGNIQLFHQRRLHLSSRVVGKIKGRDPLVSQVPTPL